MDDTTPRALVPAAPVVEGVVEMTRREAETATAAIVAAADSLRVMVDRFDQARGWRAMGYESFGAWARAEIPDRSVRHVYRELDAARVDRSLGVTIGLTPESHARALKAVPEAERPEVLARADAVAAGEGRPRQARDIATAKAQISDVRRRAEALGARLQPAEGERWAIFWPGRPVGINTSWDNLLYSLEQKEERRRAEAAGPGAKLPLDWDRARERAGAVGARLWYNESDGTYTLSERAGHVPRTSSWAEIRARLDALEARGSPGAAAAPASSPPPAPWKGEAPEELDEGAHQPLQHDADRLTALAARALAQGYLLRPHGAGLRITRRADGQPFGGAKDLDEAEALIVQWEREAGLPATAPEPAPSADGDQADGADDPRDALAARTIAAAKRILRRLAPDELLLVARLFGDAGSAEQALRGPAAAWRALNEVVQYTAGYAAEDPALAPLLDRLEGRRPPAAAPAALPAGLPDLTADGPIPLAHLAAWCDELERRWAGEGMSSADERTLDLIGDHLDELLDDTSVDDGDYERLAARVEAMGERLARFVHGEGEEPDEAPPALRGAA